VRQFQRDDAVSKPNAIRQMISPLSEGGVPALAFSDPESASKWMKALPLLPVGQAYDALLGQLHAMAAADFGPRERATIAELARDQVAHLHTELARRYAGKPQPAAEREHEAAEQSIALWQALWEQYSACLRPLLEGDPDLAGVKPKVLHRGLYVGKQLVLVYGLSRRTPPATLWQELHAYYRLAEMLDCAVAAVSDDLMPHAVGISCYATYSHALLLGLADPCALSVRQIELTDRWLGQWARKVFPYAQQRETEGPVLVVDLDGSTGCALMSIPPKNPGASMRFGYPGKLATSVRGRLKRLAAGANPAELGLGHDVSPEHATTLLSALDGRWYQTPRAQAEVARASLELSCGGLPAAFFRVCGRTFDRQDPLGRMSFQGAQHLQTLGALTDYDRHKEEAERDWPWERWQGEYHWRDALMSRPDGGHYHWFVDQLVIVRDEERMRVGHATRVARNPQNDMELTLRLWPGNPKAVALRPLSSAFNEEPPMPGILLSETPEERASMILPPRAFNAGRVFRSIDTGAERKFKATRLLYRGADFEQVAFDQTS
jgi:hypothetical protein